MDINKHIIDQRINKIVEDRPDWFDNKTDKNQKLSKAFLILSVASCLELDISEAYSCLTEGGNDAGVDAIYLGDVSDSDFTVVLFQAKYHFDLDKSYNFQANSVLRVVNAIGSIFNPSKDLTLNDLIRPKVDEIRSLILDGYIPNVRCILTNNGEKWKEEGDQHISNAKFPQDQVTFNHFNHEDIAKQLQTTKKINDSLNLTGKAIIENFAFKRVLVGKISVEDIANLMNRHGDALLEKNIRKYLGLHKNRVNSSIQATLLDENKRNNFYFFNNGITMLCSKFRHNELMDENWQLKIDNIQIINGGQTSKTLQASINDNPDIDYSKVNVLLRLYEVSEDDEDTSALTTDITIATNSQNPVDLRDLRANDPKQASLRQAMRDLGYIYISKKGTGSSQSSANNIPSSVASEAIFAVWKRNPHLAKFKRAELFGKFYDKVFSDVNAAQTIIAVLIYRYCDSQRKKNELRTDHLHLPYSNYFVSMIMGDILLEDNEIPLNELTHRNFQQVLNNLNKNMENYFDRAIQRIDDCLVSFFPEGLEDIDARRIAATFRRGDLLVELNVSQQAI